MFVVEWRKDLFGPFSTLKEAEDWAKEILMTDWVILAVQKPW